MSIKSIKTGWTGISALAGNAPIGDYESIATVSLSSAQSTVDFTNITQDYTHLQIRGMFLCSATNNPYIRVGGSSIDTGSNYSWHHLYGDGASALNNGNVSQTFAYFGYSQNATHPNATIIDILDYRSVNKNKTFRTFSGQDTNGGGEVAYWSGAWINSTTAIQNIRLIAASGNFNANSHFALYGIKG